MEEFECCVCYEHNKIKIIDCLHKICENCYLRMIEIKNNKCPICRNPLEVNNNDNNNIILYRWLENPEEYEDDSTEQDEEFSDSSSDF